MNDDIVSRDAYQSIVRQFVCTGNAFSSAQIEGNLMGKRAPGH